MSTFEDQVIHVLMRNDSPLCVQVMASGRNIPFIWLFCAKPDCTNRTYHNSIFCYPHTKGEMIEKVIDKAKEKLEAV